MTPLSYDLTHANIHLKGGDNLPTDTFLNLNDSKQKNIFEAGVREFAAKSFNQASINQIIKDAGIPRGSFYQYFEGKEDFYLYILSEIGKEKMKIAFAEPLPEDADFFASFLHMTKTILIWAREHPQYYRIGMLMETDSSDFITKLINRVPDAWSGLRRMIERDKELGRIKADVDGDLVIRILTVQNMYLVKEYYRTGSEENLLRQVEDIIKIIRGGIVNV